MLKNVGKKIAIAIVIVVVVGLLSFFGILVYKYNTVKIDVSKLTIQNSGIKIYSQDYLNEVDTPNYNTSKAIVKVEDLNDHTVNAFIDTEDKRFYKHKGYDIKRIIKSMLVNIKKGNKSQGASTITQQLVKNTLLSNEKTYNRKINELILAIKTEKNFTKNEIISMYLNTIYFGSNAYGLENASQIYFDKPAKDLNLNESATLAGIIRSPSLYSPKYNPANCKKRRNIVLKQMLENNHISADEYQEAFNQNIECSQKKSNYDNSYYQQAIIEACRLLDITENELINKDYTLITFLDNDLQNNIEQTLSNQSECDKLAIVANKDGNILAYNGYSNYDLSKMKRTPSSTLKPFAVYLPLIKHNIMYNCTPVLDEPININGYAPRNAKNEYLGWISSEDAFAHSSNTCAVKLLNCLTTDKSVEFLNNLDIDISTDDKNLSLALGVLTDGISPTKLLECYTIFQNNGNKTSLHFIDKILDKNGKIIYKTEPSLKQVCDNDDTYLVHKMLHKTTQIGTAKLLQDLPYEIGSKTGTNYVNNKTLDAWNIAYTSQHCSLVWLGDATNEGLYQISSSFDATKINKNILNSLYSSSYPVEIAQPEDIVELEIDMLEYNNNHRVALATNDTPIRYKEKYLFKIDNIPLVDSEIYNMPHLNFDLEITNSGVKITHSTKESIEYELVKITDKEEIISNISNKNGDNTFIDDKVFCYDHISYKIKAKNKYTNEIIESECKEIYPKQYLISQIDNNKLQYQTKNKRWYV